MSMYRELQMNGEFLRFSGSDTGSKWANMYGIQTDLVPAACRLLLPWLCGRICDNVFRGPQMLVPLAFYSTLYL